MPLQFFDRTVVIMNRVRCNVKLKLPGSLVLLIILSGSCKFAGKEDVEASTFKSSPQKLTLIIRDTLSLALDSTTSFQSFNFQFRVFGGLPYFYMVNITDHSLLVFRIDKGDLVKKILFSSTGPHANPLQENFYFHNWDSIFFIANEPNRILLFDSAGVKRGSWAVKFRPEHADFYITTMEYNFIPSFSSLRKTITFWMIPPVSPRHPDFFLKATAVEYNLEDNRYKTFGKFPENYLREKGGFMVLLSMNHYETGEYHVIYFAASHLVFLYRKYDKKLLKNIEVRSSFLKESIMPLESDSNTDIPLWSREAYYLTTGFYENMFSNENFTYHYRIVKHPVELRYPNGSMRSRDDFPFSIMVLDDNFNLIEEREFPGGVFNYRMSFAWGNKMYMSLNNPLNPTLNENELKFAVFELVPGDN